MQEESDDAGARVSRMGAAMRRAGAMGAAAFQGIGTAAGWAAGKLLSFVTTFAKWATVGVAAAISAAGVATFKWGAELEKTRLQYQVMLGSVEKGNAVIKELYDFANFTPFDTDEIIQSGRVLMGFGMQVGEMLSTLRTVGDVAAGTGKNFEELSFIIGKVYAKGIIDSMMLNQLNAAGIPILEELGSMYNVNSRELYNMAERGELTSKAVLTAFKRMSAEGGKFGNMMARQAQINTGRWNTLTDSLRITASTLGEQLMPLAAAFLEKLQEGADRLKAMADDGTLLDKVTAIIQTSMAGIGSITMGATTGVGFILAGVETVGSAIMAAASAIGTLLAGRATAVVAIVETIVDTIIGAYNLAMDLFGGDKIQSEAFEFTKGMASYTADLAAQTGDFAKSTVSDDRWLALAEAEIAAQTFFDKLNGGIDDALAEAKNSVNRPTATLGNDTAVARGGTSGAESSAASVTAPTALDDVSVDSLAALGLFNWMGPTTRLDTERNNLLSRAVTYLAAIVDATEAQNTTITMEA